MSLKIKLLTISCGLQNVYPLQSLRQHCSYGVVKHNMKPGIQVVFIINYVSFPLILMCEGNTCFQVANILMYYVHIVKLEK